MNRLLIVFCTLFCVSLFSCSNDSSGDLDELRAENAALRKKLAEGKSVINIRFQDKKMVLVYSDGTELKVDMPESLAGKDGKDGVSMSSMSFNEKTNELSVTMDDNTTFTVEIPKPKDNGIKNFEYDGATGNVTITLNNGEKSTFFLFVDRESKLRAVLLEDVKGKAFIQRARLGDVPIVSISYDDQFRVTGIVERGAHNGNVIVTSDLQKTYTGTSGTISLKEYALEKTVKAQVLERFYSPQSIIVDLTKEQAGDGEGGWKSYFALQDADGSYSMYSHHLGIGEKRQYKKWSGFKGVLKDTHSYEYSISESVVGHASTFLIYNHDGRFKKSDGKYLHLYYKIRKIEVKTVNPGDLVSSQRWDVKYNDQGKVSRLDEIDKDDNVIAQTVNTFNAEGKLVKVEEYSRNEEGQLVRGSSHIEFVYLQGKHVKSIKKEPGKADKEILRVEYDKKGNPLNVWRWEEAMYKWKWEIDPQTGFNKYQRYLLKDAGFYHVVEMEYNYNYKNFFGNTINSLFPDLEGLKLYNAPKRIYIKNTTDFTGIKYSEFGEKGYPRRVEGFGYSTDSGLNTSAELRVDYQYAE